MTNAMDSQLWNSRRVLVTGGSGFIGSHLTECLVQLGARVRALVHYNSRNDWGLLELMPREFLAQVDIFPGDLTDTLHVRNTVED